MWRTYKNWSFTRGNIRYFCKNKIKEYIGLLWLNSNILSWSELMLGTINVQAKKELMVHPPWL